jgi:hypothetical protein
VLEKIEDLRFGATGSSALNMLVKKLKKGIVAQQSSSGVDLIIILLILIY